MRGGGEHVSCVINWKPRASGDGDEDGDEDCRARGGGRGVAVVTLHASQLDPDFGGCPRTGPPRYYP